MPPNTKILSDEKLDLKARPVTLTKPQRAVVKSAIEEVSAFRKYFLHAVSVRTNHIHAVVASAGKPERVMGSFKSYATRKLRERGLLSRNIKPWARHGSTRYLWTEEQLADAIEYVVFGQGDEPFR